MSNCKLFNTNFKFYDIVKKKLLTYSGDPEQFLDFVSQKSLEFKKNAIVSKFVTDQDVAEIANEIIEENPDRFSSITASGVTETISKKITKNKSGILPQFVITNNIREPFKSSQSAYDYMESEFRINMFKSAFINKEKGLIVKTDKQLNKYLTEYKNSLFNTLKEYIGLNTEENLYNEDSIVNYDLYNKVMFDTKITSIYNRNFNISPLIKSHRENLFNIVNAIYILNNFDTLVKELIPGIITINQDYFGYLDNGLDLQKYSLSSATLQSLYWKADNDEVKDATLYVSNLTKLISSIIPLVDKNGNTVYGKFLGRNALYKISALIKKAEMDNMKRNPTTFEPFISNPTKMLKYYLTSSGYDSLDNNEKIVKSLAKFLYDDSDIEVDGQKIQNTSINTIQSNEISNNLNGNLTNNVDLLGLLAFEISKIVSPEYKKYNINGSSTIELSSLDEATGFIKDTIKVNILGYLDDTTIGNPYFIKKLIINGTEVDVSSNDAINKLNADQINSIEFKNYFYSISGLELTNKLIQDLNYNNLGHAVSIIKDMVKNITSSFNLITDELKNVKYEDPKEDGNRQDFIDNTIDSKLNNTNYVSFSRAIASDVDNNIITVIEDSQGNKIPVYRLNSAMFNDAYYIKNYNYSDNLFVNNPNVLSNDNNIDYNTSTSLRLEGESNEGTIKKASTYSSDESFYASFFGDFLTSIYKNDIFSTQPVAYSDKSSILLKNINLKAKIKVSDEVYNIYKEDNKSKTEIKGIKEISLGDLSNNALKQLYFEYQKAYFENIVSDVVKDWSKIIPGLDTRNILESINKINNYLKDTHPTKDGKNPSIYSSILNLKKQGINVNIVNELHYSKYNKLEFNRDLLNNYTNTRTKATFDKFFKQSLNTFVDNKFPNELLSPSRLNISNSSIEGVGVDNLVSKLFGKGSIDYSNFNKFTTKDPLIKENILSIESKIGNEVNPLLERYLLLTNFIKDQYLGLTVKHPYIHKIKYKNQSIEDESSDRVKASMKRMVILPATLENYTQGLLNGVPKKYKVAIVEDDVLPVFNHKGELKDQDIYDGSAWSNPIMSILEENSLPSKGIKGTKKPIGTYSGNGFSMLFKYAQFPLTNELILNSSFSKNSMFRMMKKMNDLQWKDKNGKYYNIDITKNFKGGNFQPDNALNKSLYILSGDKYLKISSIQNLNIFDSTIGNTYKIVYEVVDINGNPIKIDGKTQREIINRPINSIFELWQTLGGQYSMELINGKLDYSENSISATAQYVNNIGILKDTEAVNKGFNFKKIEKIVTDYNTETVYQPLKDFMIGILANSSAVKNGITNLNPSSVLLGDDELIYSEIDITNFGIQLDANHEADFSELTEMSQVISALSANGYTQTEAKKAFKEIANIIKTSMSKTSMMVNNNMSELLYDEMSKILVNTLASVNKISLAHSIVSQVKSRLEDGFNDLIPISNPNFFNLFTTDVLSRLNRSALKRKYSGLGGVLNPSAKIVEMFEDKNGNTYNVKDLLNNAIEEYKNGELKELISDNDRIIYGHNTLGKSYLFSGKNSPFISLDDDFKPDQNKFIDEHKLPTETRQDYKARHPEEYNKFLLDLWEITKQTALSQNKKAIVSNHHILKQRPQDFDKVFTLTPDEFKRRLIQRGSTEKELNKINPLTGKTTFNDWKDNLDEAVNNVDQSKVVVTNKYLSDLIINNENIIKAYITKYFSNEIITKDKINLFDTIDIKDTLGNLISRKEILTPGDLYDLQKLPNDLIFEKVYSVSRDLKPMNITWNDGVNQSNIWNLPSIKLKFNLKNILTDPANYKQESLLLNQFLNYIQKDGENLFEDFLNGKNLTRINNELNNWTQKLTEQLQQGQIFDESFLLVGDFNSYFNTIIPVNNVQISEAEIILPKINRTVFKMNNNSLAQIKKEGANYFKKELSSNYDAPIDGLDFFIRTENDSIGVRIGKFKDKTINGIQGNLVKLNKEIDEDGIVYRLNEKGDRMYILPKGSEIYVYDLNGKAVEVVYLPDFFEKVNEKEYIKNGKISISSVFDIVNEDYDNFIKSVKYKSSLVILGNNLNSILKLKLLTDLGSKYNHVREYKDLYSSISYEISPMWSDEEYQTRLLTMKKALLEEFQNKDYYLDGIANSMYTSFLKSLNVISARIPSQALQSFMPMKTVGFTENKSNDIYVSHWQLWLQGSDLDIDKAYTMMYSINDSGIYDYWSPLFDFSSLESLTLSENLPTPNKYKIKFNNTSTKSKQLNVIQVSSNEEIPENGINITPYLISPYSLENIIPLLELIDSSIENNNFTFYSTLEDKFGILDKVNEHNNYKVSSDASKNKVVKSIRSVSNNLKNLLSSYSPISMDDFTNLLKTIDSADKKSIYDGYSVFEIQEENYIGKSVVGVMANGVKAFFTLTQYFNNYFSKGNVDILDNEFFIKEFNITGTPVYKSTIADVKFNENQFDIFNQYLQIVAPEAYEKGITIRHDNHDASLLLSALVSLATDNAKELALAKLNAGLEMASMHVYLTIMGFTPEEIVSYMTSPMVNDIAKNLKSNIFTGKETTIAKVIGQLVKDELPGIEEFNNIYQSAQELRHFTNQLSINQGVKSDIYTIKDFTLKLSDGFESAESLIFKGIPLTLDKKAKKAKAKFYREQIRPLKEKIKEESEKPDTDKDTELIEKLTLEYDTKLKLYLEPIIINDKDKLDLINKLAVKIKNNKPYFDGLVEEKQKEVDDYIYNVLNNAINLNILGNRLDFNKYFSDKKYREGVTNYYNLIKNTFNYFDVINKSPNFFEMLTSLNTTLNSIKIVSKKADFIFNEVPQIIKDNQELLKDSVMIRKGDDTNDSNKFIDKNGRLFKYNSEFLRKSLDYYDDYVIGDFLASDNLQHFKFNISDLSNLLNKDIKLADKGYITSNNRYFDLSNGEGIRQFKYLMEHYIIKEILKKEHNDNAFVKNLQLNVDKKTNKNIYSKNKSFYKLAINMKDLTTPSDINLYFELLNGFNKLSEQDSPIQNIYGENLKWGELLYTYNLIINKDKFGPNRLTKIFEDYMHKENSLAYKLAMHYGKFEKGDKKLDVDAKNLFFSLFAYNKDQSISFTDGQKIKLTDPDYTIITKLDKYYELENNKVNKIMMYLKNNGFLLDLICE